MLELKNVYPDLIIPSYFHIGESHKEWRIIHCDYETDINSLFDGKIDATQIMTPVKGRGEYIVSNIQSSSGKKEQAIIKTYKRGGLTGLLLPDIFNNARRPLNELVLTEKAHISGVPVPEILGIQIKWITSFLFGAKIIFKKIPDTMTLEEVIVSVLQNYKNNRSKLYQKKKNIIKSISQTIGQLHHVGICHNDLNVRNILIQSTRLIEPAAQAEEERIKTYIIDLDKSTYEQPLQFDKRIDNLIRLNRSLEKIQFRFKSLDITDIVSHTDRLSLFETYFNEFSLEGKDQKRLAINKCLKHTRLHKWWWRLYGGG
jgi:tRNA A-37 threonylcarbamoyl transferase component Bud32